MEATRVRILSYNIRHGQGIGGVVSSPRVARVISQSDCDLVALSEVWRVARMRFDQPALLGELTGMRPVFHALHRSMGRDMGNAILSRLPVNGVHEIPLGGRREQRGCVVVEVECKGVGFSFAATHLSLHRATRSEQIETLARELPTDRPLILAGDFNCRREDLAPLLSILRFTEQVPATYPSPMPFLALDHIGFSAHWKVESLTVVRSWASDHLPLLAEFSI